MDNEYILTVMHKICNCHRTAIENSLPANSSKRRCPLSFEVLDNGELVDAYRLGGTILQVLSLTRQTKPSNSVDEDEDDADGHIRLDTLVVMTGMIRVKQTGINLGLIYGPVGNA